MTMKTLLRVLYSATTVMNIAYAILLAYGIWMLASGLPPTPVSQHVSDLLYTWWMSMHIVVPITSWTGQVLQLPRFGCRFAWEIRLTADVGAFFLAFTTFIAAHAAGVADDIWQACVLMLLAVLLVSRDVLEIVERERGHAGVPLYRTVPGAGPHVEVIE